MILWGVTSSRAMATLMRTHDATRTLGRTNYRTWRILLCLQSGMKSGRSSARTRVRSLGMPLMAVAFMGTNLRRRVFPYLLWGRELHGYNELRSHRDVGVL